MSSAGRGRGGKFSKPKRGGGKHFSRDTLPTNRDGEQVSMWADKEDVEGSGDDSSEESSSDDEGGPSIAQQAQPEMTREERRAAKKARKGPNAKAKTQEQGAEDSGDSSEDEDGEGDLPANPNHTNKAAKQAAETPVAEAEAVKSRRAVKNGDMENLSRREREAIEKERAKERYEKLHREGKTDEAKADLERLAVVRERREAEAARKKAEKEEREEHERQKKEQMERDERNRALKHAKASRGANNKKKKDAATNS